MIVTILAFIFLATPEPPPPHPPENIPGAVAGELCFSSTGATFTGQKTTKLHAGYVWYCQMPDPNTNRTFDKSDCFFDYSWLPGDPGATYCSINEPFVHDPNGQVGGIPAWAWITGGALLLIVLSRQFGPGAPGWQKTNIPGVMVKKDKK